MIRPDMTQQNKAKQILRFLRDDQSFITLIGRVENLISKLLAIGMIVVLLVTVWDLGVLLVTRLLSDSAGFFKTTLIDTLGLFLSVLIALEVLENITAYLRQHTVQMELVISTSLTAIARKIIILDLEQTNGVQVIGLGVVIFTLALSYWIVRRASRS
jgi:uncharacterized membrane protein (DUF373 family)